MIWVYFEGLKSYRRGSGGSRCAVVPWVTEALGVRQTGSAAVASSLTRPAVLCSATTRLVGVGALKFGQMLSTERDACKTGGAANRSRARRLTGGQARAAVDPGGQ